MERDCHVVLCTCPDAESARAIAGALIDRHLAACVNIMPEIHSLYRWRGVREEAAERLLIIKSRAAIYAELQEMIRALHPYELPEIIALPISAGLPGYLAWIAENTA